MKKKPLSPKKINPKKLGDTLKLKFELIPAPLWQINLRSEKALGKTGWTKLREKLLAEHGESGCTTCDGHIIKAHAHEVWEYDEKRKPCLAKVVAIKTICTNCHEVHHFGRMRALFQKGIIPKSRMLELKRHFLRVNQCTSKEFDAHQESTAKDWLRRNKQTWAVDYGPYTELIK